MEDSKVSEGLLLGFFLQLAEWSPDGPKPNDAEITRAVCDEAEQNGLSRTRIYEFPPEDQLDVLFDVRRDLGSLERQGLVARQLGTSSWDLTEEGRIRAREMADRCPSLHLIVEQLPAVFRETRTTPRPADPGQTADTMSALQA